MRLDALAGAVRQLVYSIDYDQSNAEADRLEAEQRQWMDAMSEPAGFVHVMIHGGDASNYVQNLNGCNALSKYF